MAFKVFLSYSVGPDELALPWRLQTDGAAHGIQIYVPRRKGYQAGGQAAYREAAKQDRSQMERADCVLAIITAENKQARPALADELGRAVRLSKTVVPIVQKGLERLPVLEDLRQKTSTPTFILSAQDGPGKVEWEVVEYLKKQPLSEQEQRALGALVALAVGQILLFSLAEK